MTGKNFCLSLWICLAPPPQQTLCHMFNITQYFFKLTSTATIGFPNSFLPVLERANNFPPLPKIVKIKPCFYQNIEEEIPDQYQHLVRRVYQLWMSECPAFIVLRVTIIGAEWDVMISLLRFLPSAMFPLQCILPHCAWMSFPVLPGGPEVEVPPTLVSRSSGSFSSVPAVTPAGSGHSTKPSGESKQNCFNTGLWSAVHSDVCLFVLTLSPTGVIVETRTMRQFSTQLSKPIF